MAEQSQNARVLRFPLGPREEEEHDISGAHKRMREWQSRRMREVDIYLVEYIDKLAKAEDHADKHYGLFIWPAAMVLAHFVAFHNTNMFADRMVLELGCGTALPGILAAVCGNPQQVLLTDRSDSMQIQRSAITNIELNDVSDVVAFMPLDWGHLRVVDQMRALEHVDIILAADCFYQSEDFEKVLATVAVVFRYNPSCKFYTAYQLRSINRSIAPLLMRWGMTARVIDKSEFMHGTVTGSESVYVYEITPSKPTNVEQPLG